MRSLEQLLKAQGRAVVARVRLFGGGRDGGGLRATGARWLRRTYTAHHNAERPHRALALVPPEGNDKPNQPEANTIERHDILVRLIHEYRAAPVNTVFENPSDLKNAYRSPRRPSSRAGRDASSARRARRRVPALTKGSTG
jgi:hypothetical protein